MYVKVKLILNMVTSPEPIRQNVYLLIRAIFSKVENPFHQELNARGLKGVG
jgi:hypothetical protein